MGVGGLGFWRLCVVANYIPELAKVNPDLYRSRVKIFGEGDIFMGRGNS